MSLKPQHGSHSTSMPVISELACVLASKGLSDNVLYLKLVPLVDFILLCDN